MIHNNGYLMKKHSQDEHRSVDNLGRRDFNTLLVGAVAAGSIASTARAAAPTVIEKDVQVRMSTGSADAAFFHPSKGPSPGVLIWVDAFGLRPAFRDMGRKLAAAGYAVLIPNPYYRTTRSPDLLPGFSFQNPEHRAKLMGLMGTLTPAAVQEDAVAYVDFLDSQPQVHKSAKIGTNGYCMGGPFTMRAAAARPDRVGAGASFHGGGLVTDGPDSPHLLIPKMKCHYYFGIASNDDKSQPEAKNTLRSSFEQAKLPAEIEVYEGAMHGWCLPDIPTSDGSPIYNPPMAEKAFNHLLSLYKATLI